MTTRWRDTERGDWNPSVGHVVSWKIFKKIPFRAWMVLSTALWKWPNKYKADISIFMPFIHRIPLARGRGESFKFEGKLQEESLVYVMLKNISSAIERTHSLPETPLTCGIELEIVRNIILSFRKTDARKYPPRNMSITSSITFLLSTANWIDMFRKIHVRFENLMGLHDQYDHVFFTK